MYSSYLCDRTFKDSSEVLNIFRVLRRRCWGDILQTLDAIAYSKVASGKDYHNGWIKIEQSKLAARTNYTRSYLSTQILELQAVGLLELKRENFECYCYKFTSLAKEIFQAIARLPIDRFAEIKSLVRDRLYQFASEFSKFTAAPIEQITSLWSQIRESLTTIGEKLTGDVHFSPYIQDPFQEPYQQTSKHTDLTRVCDKNDDPCMKDPEPEPCQPPVTQSPAEESVSTNNSPSEKDLPPEITIVSNGIPDCDLSSVARFDRSIRTYQPTDDITAQLVEIYNKYKPDHWGKCTAIGAHMPRQIAAHLRRYGDAQILISEWGAAILALKANPFYNSPKFQSGNINFLLDPTKPDRIPQLAQAWRDRPQQQKEQLAHKMVAAANGIPRWENPDVVLSGAMLHLRRDRYAGYVAAGDFENPQCPSIEYLQTYFPEIFKNA